MAHVLPACAVLLDMMMNRIRIPWHHIVYNIVFVTLYLFGTYMYEIYDGFEAIYPHSLNWNCKYDFSFLYYRESKIIETRTIKALPCSENHSYLGPLTCQTLYPYYCHVPDKEYSITKEYSSWTNRNLFIASIYTITVLTFLISWLVHKFKAGLDT